MWGLDLGLGVRGDSGGEDFLPKRHYFGAYASHYRSLENVSLSHPSAIVSPTIFFQVEFSVLSKMALSLRNSQVQEFPQILWRHRDYKRCFGDEAACPKARLS
jgi:hypothetical protein